jgi:hypothetical protein
MRTFSAILLGFASMSWFGTDVFGFHGTFLLAQVAPPLPPSNLSVLTNWPPTNAAPAGPVGMVANTAAFYNYRDVPTGATTAWTNEMPSGEVFRSWISGGTIPNSPANTAFGWWFYHAGFTNVTPMNLGTNFSVWMVMAPVQVPATSQIIGNMGSSGSLSANGLNVSTTVKSTTNCLVGRWGAVNHIDQQWFGTVQGLGVTNAPIWQDVVYSSSTGSIYLNGSPASGNLGTPASNVLWQAIGNDANGDAFNGYIKYLLIATNHAMTATEASNLWVWEQTNGVTNVTSGLVAWYKFNDAPNSPTLADSSGNGFTITNYGSPAPVWTTGLNSIVSQAVGYDGVQSYSQGVLSGMPVFFTHPHAATISIWFYFNNTSDEGQFMTISSSTASTAGGATVFSDSAYGTVRGAAGVGKNYNESGSLFLGNSGWHHVVFADNEEFTAPPSWCDGIQEISMAETGLQAESTGGTPATNWYVGFDTVRFSTKNLTGNNAQCVVTDVRIYNRVLNDAEVDILYRSPAVDKIIGSYTY